MVMVVEDEEGGEEVEVEEAAVVEMGQGFARAEGAVERC